MKRIFITLLILTGIYSAALAQQKGDVQIGINTGLNFSTFTNSDNSFVEGYNSYIPGVNFGFSAEYYFSDRWSIKGKIIYDQKGTGDGTLTFTQPENDGESQITYGGLHFHTNYITVPIMANWHFGRTRNWYIHFGPYVGFLASAKATSGGGSLDNQSVDIKDQLNSVDGGLALGIGVKFPIAKNVSLFLEDDGQAGVASVFKENDGFSNALTERSSLNIGLIFSVK